MIENAVISMIIAFIFGLIASWLFERSRPNQDKRKWGELDARLFSLEEKYGSLKGRQTQLASVDRKEEEAEYMASAMAIMKSGEGSMQDKLLKCVALNPKLAMKLGKKLGIGI